MTDAITKNTTISVALAVAVMFIIVGAVTSFVLASSKIDNHVASPAYHQYLVDKLEDDYIPRGELILILGRIEENVEEIRSAVIK